MTTLQSRLLEELVPQWGTDAPVLAPLAVRLAADPAPEIQELVQEFNLPYRLVKSLIQSKAEGLLTSENVGNLSIDPILPLHELATSTSNQARESTKELEILREFIKLAPNPVHDLDHVVAKAETVLSRALLIKQRYYYRGINILCLGDHDLTSLACGLTMPDAEISVCDIDELLLRYLNDCTKSRFENVKLFYTDLRIRLNRSLHDYFDLVITDPPYSSDGVALFCARALQSIRTDRPTAMLLCYGSSIMRPDLAYDVQEAMSGLRILIEALIPRFNQYDGAHAIGATSDLYVLRPTRRSRAAAAAFANSAKIYSRGKSSVDSRQCNVPSPFAQAINEIIGTANRNISYIGEGWPDTQQEVQSAASIPIQQYFKSVDVPPAKSQGSHRPFADVLAVTLLPDYQHLEYQVVFSSNATDLFLVGDSMLQTLTEEGALLDNFVRSKYEIVNLHRDQNTTSMMLHLRRLPAPPETSQVHLLRFVADRWAAKVRNSWREGLISYYAANDRVLSKKAALEVMHLAMNETEIERNWPEKTLADFTRLELKCLAAQIVKTTDLGKASP